MDLMMRGVPRDAIDANVERLRHGARDEAVRELKLSSCSSRSPTIPAWMSTKRN